MLDQKVLYVNIRPSWLEDPFEYTMASLGKIFPKILKEFIFSGIWEFFIIMALKDVKETKKLKKANEGLKGHSEGQRA